MGTLLWEALDVLREGGMIKGNRGDTRDRQSGHCALGLIDCVITNKECYSYANDIEPDYVALAEAASTMFPDRAHPSTDKFNGYYGFGEEMPVNSFPNQSVIAAFNNHPATTMDDLIQVFEKAAIQRDEIIQ